MSMPKTEVIKHVKLNDHFRPEGQLGPTDIMQDAPITSASRPQNRAPMASPALDMVKMRPVLPTTPISWLPESAQPIAVDLGRLTTLPRRPIQRPGPRPSQENICKSAPLLLLLLYVPKATQEPNTDLVASEAEPIELTVGSALALLLASLGDGEPFRMIDLICVPKVTGK